MANSSATYHPIPSSEDEDIHETTFGGDNLHSNEWISLQARMSWTCFLLGCASLLPWNALINASPFFLSRLAGSSFYLSFNSSLSSVYTITILIFQFYCTITSKQSSQSRRAFGSITTATLLVASLCFSTFVQGTPSGFFTFTLLNAVLLAITTAYLSTAVLGVAALLGTPFLQTVLSGKAAIGVAVSCVEVASAMISLWGTPSNGVIVKVVGAPEGNDEAEAMAARIFFGVSTIFLAITIVAYAWLTRQPFYKSVTRSLEQRREGGADELARLTNWIFMFSITYVFWVTLAVYPAITVRIRSVDSRIHPLLFASVHFLAYNVGDLVGRYSCSLPRLVVWSAKKILTMALLRTLFIPILLLCNVDRPTPTIPIINSDILFMIILLAMGYTNGYVSSLAMLAVSSLEHNPRLEGRREDVDVAATLGAAFMNVGLAAGALSSFGVQAIT